jgi:nucleotide-binding universal stress UspA family protein
MADLHRNRQRIVVALDGSELAERILPIVSAMAARTGAKLTLVRAYVPDEEEAGTTAAGFLVGLRRSGGQALQVRASRHEIARYMADMVERLRAEGLEADFELLVGDPGEAIVDEAEGLGAELIAMTTHGRTGLRRLALGSVAGYVVGHASCPVLLTRAA